MAPGKFDAGNGQRDQLVNPDEFNPHKAATSGQDTADLTGMNAINDDHAAAWLGRWFYGNPV